MRGRIHQISFFVSVPAGIALIALADGSVATAAATIYAVSLTGVFAASAAYHRGNWTPRARLRMRILDHSMIFVLIAASYTPVSILALDGSWTLVLLSLVWVGAAAGVVMKIARPDGLSATTGALYVSMGWIAMIAAPQLIRGLEAPAIAMLVIGGVLYTAGAIVFALKRPDPRPLVFGYHEIWHSFMVAASACHFVLVLLVVTR